MQTQLVKSEKSIVKKESGVLTQVGAIAGKMTDIFNNSKDKTKDKEYLNSDLFAQMTYMAAVSSSGLPRNQIITSAAQLPYSSSTYFKDIDAMVHKLNYDYPEACRRVGEKTMESEPRAILLRMAGTFVSGEPEHIFLKREAAVQGETYQNAYERDLQTLKNWTDAYIALLLSASLIIIVGVISMMIYPVQDSFIMFLAFLTIIVTVAGAWVIHRAAPKEIKTHTLSTVSRGQKIATYLVKTMVPAGMLLCLILGWLNVDVGWIMLAGSIMMLPPGLVIVWDDRNIDKQDNDISGVIRSLGGAAKAISSTISHAVSKLDIKSTHSLQGCISRLQTRLLTGINPSICWEMFVGETGSEQIHRSMYIFRDAVNMGADPEIASDQASLYAMKINLLRAKRALVSSNFTWLCLVMHAVVSALMLFIYGVLRVFSEAIGTMGSLESESNMSLPQFGFMGDTAQMELFGTLVTVIIIIFTIANAFAARACSGGHHYKFFFYLGVTMFMSAMCFLVVPPVVNMALGTMGPM